MVYAVTKERKGESTARKDVSARTRKNPTQPASHHCSPTHATSRATCKTPHPCPIRTTTLAPWCRYMQCLTGVPQQVLDSSSSQELLQCYGKHDTLPLYHDAWTCGGERQNGHSGHAVNRDIGSLKLVVEASSVHVWCAQVRVSARRKVYVPSVLVFLYPILKQLPDSRARFKSRVRPPQSAAVVSHSTAHPSRVKSVWFCGGATLGPRWQCSQLCGLLLS